MARETELRCDKPQLCFNRGGKQFFTQSHVGLGFVFPSFRNYMLCLLVLSLINISISLML